MMVVVVLKALSALATSDSTVGLVAFIIVSPRFYTSIRNEAIGWMFESIVYLVIPVLMIFIAEAFRAKWKKSKFQLLQSA